MEINNLYGLYNPKDLETRTITVGELNNLLGTNIAILKVIGVITEYKDFRLYSQDRKIREELTNELRTKTQKKYSGTPIAETTIYIKIINTSGDTDNNYYLKLVETINLNDERLNLNFNSEFYNKLTGNRYKGLTRHRKIGNGVTPYYLDVNLFQYKKLIKNRFDLLLGVEFVVTGLGIPIDERVNTVDALLVLDGGLCDYIV